MQLIQQPDLSEPQVEQKHSKFKGYYKISRHYNWALNLTFSYGYDFVIIVEGIKTKEIHSFIEIIGLVES